MHAIDINKITLEFYENSSNNFSIKNTLLNRKFLPPKKIIFKDFSLHISENTILGIEGPNGVGKSSLLAAISGKLPLKSGSIDTRGRVLPLLGLGHIFHPDLDVQQNINLWSLSFNLNFNVNDDFIKKIIDYAEINVSKNTILRSFSSGMKSKLAFSLAMHSPADILLLDEVFAVGDKAFKKKSIERMHKKLKSINCAILVSHESEFLKATCSRIISINGPSSFSKIK